MKGTSGISGRKNYNRRGSPFYAKPEGGQNLKGGDLGIKVGLRSRKTPWNYSSFSTSVFSKISSPSKRWKETIYIYKVYSRK